MQHTSCTHPIAGCRIEAVTFAGNEIPVGVCIICLLDRIRNAKQYLGLALIGAARQKQCQTENGKVSFPASQNKVSHGCAIITPSVIADTAPRTGRSCRARSSLDNLR
jgi:hypothetical protein